jgi:cytochrome c oxidase assembly factor CtaG
VKPTPWAFSWEPLFLVLAVVAALAYIRAARRERPSNPRAFAFALGLALIVAALCTPLETIARRYLLLFHLLGNVMIADWAPPLLIIGLTPSMRSSLARLGGRALARVSRPWIALPAWLAVWYLVHLPGFYDYALRHTWALNLEHGLLLAAGLVFWWPLLGDASTALTTPIALAYLGVAFVSSAFLGLAFIFSSTAFYDFYKHAPRLWGLSAAKDQNLGGILMNSEQTVVFLSALAYFLLRLLNEEEGAEALRAG